MINQNSIIKIRLICNLCQEKFNFEFKIQLWFYNQHII